MAFLDVLLGWILLFHPAMSIFIISVLISLAITLALKFLTDQTLMKDLKAELKELQKEMKELRSNPKKMAKVNDRFMQTNMKYMSHSMKPTLFTFIPIILVFGWMNSHIGFYPLLPNTPFELTAEFEEAEGMVEILVPDDVYFEGGESQEITRNKVSWQLSGEEGKYEIKLLYNDKEYLKKVIITEERNYAPVEKSFTTGFLFFKSKDENGLRTIKVSNEKILPFKDVPILEDIPWVKDWGWFGAYFLFSIIFSMLFRKVLKVH